MATPTKQGEAQGTQRADQLRVTEEANEQAGRGLARRSPSVVDTGEGAPLPRGIHGLQRLVGNRALRSALAGDNAVQRIPAPVLHQLATGGVGNRNAGALLGRPLPEREESATAQELPTAQRFLGELVGEFAGDLFEEMFGGKKKKKKEAEAKKKAEEEAKKKAALTPKAKAPTRRPLVGPRPRPGATPGGGVTSGEPETETMSMEESEGITTRPRSNAITSDDPYAIRMAERRARLARNRRGTARSELRRRRAPDLSGRRRPGMERRARLRDERMWGSERRTARRSEVRGARTEKTTAFRQWYERRLKSGEPVGKPAQEKAKFEEFWARRQNERRETSPGLTDDVVEGVGTLFGEGGE
ncbi:MAG TPA: hypothetical protein VNF07_01100 [Acidimicrobiales bacterium]|nr:hypothetical protein [Acidimicrobiales bacterium]